MRVDQEETVAPHRKFIQAARELEADEDEGRWEERLKKVAKARSAETGPQAARVPKPRS
jgi:hypothetical protein